MGQLGLQLLAALLGLGLYALVAPVVAPLWPVTVAIGFIGATLATLLDQPRWWRLIHLGFAPLVVLATTLDLPPNLYLGLALLLFLFFRGAAKFQVPLYLSNRTTARALSTLLEGKEVRFLDLGAGIGSVVRPVCRACPNATVTGVEYAPGTWLVGRLLTLGRPRLIWSYGDLFKTDLRDFDVVYAFLSPAPMPALWQKVVAELRPGALFISNSFEVPGVPPTMVIQLDDRRATRLYGYRR